MNNDDVYAEFNKSRKANSPWLTLVDGEAVNITVVRSMKPSTKKDPQTGVTSAVMSLELDVETSEGLKVKSLETSSSRLVTALQDNGIKIGSSFTLKKIGEKFETRYEISDVVNKPSNTVQASSTVAGVGAATPAEDTGNATQA